MTLETDQMAVETAFNQFAPEECPIIEGVENDDLIDASIQKVDGIIESVSIQCEGTDNPVCDTCPIKNKEKVKNYTL